MYPPPHSLGECSITPMVSIVAVTHNRKNKIIRLLDSLERSSSQNFLEIIVVDDASSDGTSEEISVMFPRVRLLRLTRQVLLAKARNIGAFGSKAKYILFVDDDVVVEIDSIKRVLAFMDSHPDYGMAGPVVAYFGNRDKIWHAGVCYRPSRINENRYIWNHCSLNNIRRPTFMNCCYLPGIFMVRRKVFNDIKGFDSEDFAFSYEDIDLALRIQSMGYKTACVLSALALHDIHEPSIKAIKSTRAFHHGRSRARFYLKYLKWKLLWLPVYYLGFVFELSKHDTSFRIRLQITTLYLKGMIHGITGK